jgi:orotidine-5'-phosphate decarboxylase
MLSKIIVALDFSSLDQARALLKDIKPEDCRVKIGKQMFTLYGPDFVRECIDLGFDVFLDLKFHDIPHTVASAVTAACELGVWMLTVHVQGGREMLCAARAAIDAFSGRKPMLVGVTVLTSLCEDDLTKMGILQPMDQVVLNYAEMACQARLDGVVCSSQEAMLLKQRYQDALLLVTPGIRLQGDNASDQKRVLTPKAAQQAGADYLVIGRSITQAKQPAVALQTCLLELS